jgi:anti-sigma28 factor (negative regulator of flagellin synthesis)
MNGLEDPNKKDWIALMFQARPPIYVEELIKQGAGPMRNTNRAIHHRAGDDSMHAAAMAGMHLANEGRRKLDRNLCEAQAWADETEKAQLAQSLIQQSAASGDVRLDLVVRLRDAITAGTYRVRSSDVAEKMMGSMRR